MPLAKGSSQKVVSRNISELVHLLDESMLNVLHMLKRVAVRAENLKIAHIIIFCISIFMVNAKYFFLRIITAPFALIYHASCKHIFSNRLKHRKPYFLFWLINASYAAILPCLRWACEKLFPAMVTIARNGPFRLLRFCVACFATVLSFVGSRRNVRELIPTYSTVCSNLNASCQSLAGSRTILEAIESVLWYINNVSAVPARHMLSSARF